MDNIKLNYDDITIVPEEITDICSRKECNPYDEDGYLPVFASCMSSVVSMENVKDYNDNHIKVVLPRNYSVEDRISFMLTSGGKVNFTAFSLQEAKDIFIDDKYNLQHGMKRFDSPLKICIDLANGHMKCLIDLVKEIKSKWGKDISIMTGNIANPKTYKDYCDAGIDYVRCNIGTGAACFVEGTLVTMADGTKEKIEEIDRGDFVKTLNGAERVISIFKKKTDTTIVINDNVECTPNHKFFVIKKSDYKDGMPDEEIVTKGIYISAEDLSEDFLLVEE